MELIREEGYEETMERVVMPYLLAHRISGDMERISGQKLHYRVYHAQEPRADLVLVHGFTEGIDKFNEAVYYLLQEGFNVWQIQQRGHGKSFRLVQDPSLIHIDSYRALLDDLHFFVTEIVDRNRKDPSLPKYLFGHSMGGGVSAAYLEIWPDDFRRAVLSSPMLELDSGNLPMWAASVYARLMVNLGKGKEPMPGYVPFRAEPDFENSCTNCRVRYDYWFRRVCACPEYQMTGSSIGTALEFLRLTKYATAPKHCAKVRAEVLLVQAGLDQMVRPGGQDTFLRLIGSHGKRLRMDEAKHEIYLCSNDVLERYWQEIMNFLRS